jgi:Cu(I)/Ag(I) efflux system membrane fusion protein
MDKLKRILKWVITHAGTTVLVLVAFSAGYLLHSILVTPGVRTGIQAEAETSKKAEPEIKYWTCSMHPQIKQPDPGNCPICGMELIPVMEGESGGVEGPTLSMSEHAKTLAEIQTSPVQRRYAEAEIRLVGKVAYDETRLEDIAAWVPGRLDRMFVDYTGVGVRKGDHLVSIYSPRLIAAQEEFLQAIETEKKLEGAAESVIKQTTTETVHAARDKLELLGLTPEQVEQIKNTGEPVDHLTIHAPTGGIVVKKHKKEGSYVDTGSIIYTIADLSHVWVKLDAYESDMMWLRYGQPVTVQTEAYPGENFDGRIAFIDPVLNERTRTVKLRLDVENPDAKLKPGMFVRAIVKPKIAASGKVMEPELAGKWICRMHPGEISEEPGDCSICGMPLVRTESVGYVSVEEAEKPPLVIPTSAPLITGTRAVVYVEIPEADKPTYEGREIVLGPRAKDYYLVKSGLREGEQVVTQGNFKIDSDLQIQAEASMMNPPEGKATPTQNDKKSGKDSALNIPSAFVSQLMPLLNHYMTIRKGLSSDDLRIASQSAREFSGAIEKVDMGLLKGKIHMEWMVLAKALKGAARDISRSEDLTAQRETFSALSANMVELVKRFGPIAGSRLYVMHCPMAFDNKGADWLSDVSEVVNPYFGESMPGCGEVKEILE